MVVMHVENEDGFQDVEISKESGSGLESMGEFVRHHMQCILQPFADHVDELHRAVDLLTTDLTETAGLAHSNSSRLENHDELIAGLRSDTNSVTAQAKALARLLEETRSEKQALEADHDKTKRSFARADEQLQATAKYITDSQHGLAATNATVEELQAMTRATNENIARSIEPGIASLLFELAKLDDRVKASASLLEATKSYSEGVHADVQSHVRAYERQKLEDERSFAHVNETTTDFSTTLKETNHRLQTQADHLKTTNATVRPLKIRVEQMGVTLKAQEQKQTDVLRELTDFMDRFAHAKIQLDKLVDKFGANDDDKKKGDIFEIVTKLSETVSRNSSAISNLDSTAQLHQDHLSRDADRMSDIDTKVTDTTERVFKCEDRIGFNDPEPLPKASKWGAAKGKAGVEQPSGRQSMADVVKMMSISQGQKKNTEKLHRTADDLEQTKSSLTSTLAELQVAAARVKVLEEGLSCTNEVVAKLGAGLDLTQEYWSGLSKGFRDTHKAIAIDNELLPPKGSHAVTLPCIPFGGMGGPGSPKLPGQRRPVSQGGRPAPQTAR